MLLGGLGERVPYLFMGVVVLIFAVAAPQLTLLLFFLLLAITAFTNGLATPAWFTLIGKVLPVNRRGIFFGVSAGLGALMGIIGAYFVAQILENRDYPVNFALLFFVAFGFMAISWVGLALNREPDSLIVKDTIPFSSYVKQLPTVLRGNRNYSRYLISYSIVKLGAMSVGFFTVYGNAILKLTGAQVGLLTAVLIGSQAVMNLIWGWVGDRIGHKTVLTGSAFALALAALSAWMASSMVGMVISFVLLGTAIAGDEVSKFSIILEFAPPGDHPTYIGLTNTLLAPVIILAPLLGAALANWLGYQGMFIVAMTIAIIGGGLLALWVKEPRTVRDH